MGRPMRTSVMFLIAPCFIPVLLSADPAPTADDQPEANISVAEIAAGIAESQARIESLQVQYRRTKKAIAEESSDPWPWNQVTIAFKDSKSYCEHLRPEAGKELYTQAAFDGEVSRAQVGKRAYSINEVRTRHTEMDWYTIHTFLPFTSHAQKQMQKGDDFFLPKMLTELPYAVRRQRELVDDHSCVVVENPGKDTLWIDPQLGFAVRKRVYGHSPTSTFSTSHYYLSEFEEVASGVWLPRRSVRESFLRGPTVGRESEPAFRETIEVSKISANDVPDDLFVLSFPPGAWVSDFRDTVARGTYQVPKEGVDPLDASIKDAIADQFGTRPQKSRRIWVAANIFAIAVILFAVAFWRLRR
jgi:hypothetical protein